MIDRKRDLILIEDNATDIREVFADLRKGATANEDHIRQMAAVLKSLTEHPLNQADGSVRSLIGSFHFPLKRTIYTALVIGVSFSGGVLAAIVDPVSGGLALGGAVLAAAQQASDLFTKLTPDELVIYEALGSVLLQQRHANVPQPRGTPANIEALFEQRNEAPPDIAATLQALRDKNVVESEVTQGEIHYWIKP